MQDNQKINEISDKLKALSHPYRLSIVQGLLDESSNVSTIQHRLGIPQPSVSAHLARLKTAGIIAGMRSGQEINYRVVDPGIGELVRSLL